MRPLLAAAAATAALALLAACGSSSDDAGSDDVASSSASDGSSSTAFPVTIEHVFGETTIEAEPRRVVTIGLSDQDALLALGVVPVAVAEWYGEYDGAIWPWAQDEMTASGAEQPVVLNGGVRDEENPPVEEIASLEPDLIISLYNGTTEQQYEQLSEIAPVVLPAEEFADFTITWQEATRVTGLALGREDDAQQIVDDLEARFTDVADAHPAWADVETVVAERFEPNQSVLRGTSDQRGRFFQQLGFAVPDEAEGAEVSEFGDLVLSDELMGGLSRDLLVWNTGFGPEVRAEIEAAPLYAGLPVVQEGRVLWLDDPEISGAFTWATALSLDFALDEVVPQVEAVVGP